MAFENISKGEFAAKDNSLMISGKTGQQAIFCKQDFSYKKIDVEMIENTQFAAFCFNLQQRYDISKLEELIKNVELCIEGLNNDIHIGIGSTMHKELEQLLKQIKK